MTPKSEYWSGLAGICSSIEERCDSHNRPAWRIAFHVSQAVCVLFLFLSLQAYGVENDLFLSELAAVPRVQGTNTTNVTQVVDKYIPPGIVLRDALSYLERRGFKTFPFHGKNVPPGQTWFVAVKEERKRLVLAEKTRVIVESDGDRVLKARGWIFLVGI